MSQVQQGRKKRIVRVVITLVVLVVGAAFGVASLRSGLAEQADASALNDPDSDFVPVVGTVTTLPPSAHTSRRASTQMWVRFTTADDRRIKAMVWTRRDNDEFDKGQRIDLEYVAQRPSAARLPGNQGGEPEPWRSLGFGVAVLAGVVVVPMGLLIRAVSGRRRRVQA
jgi:hypothetical protein